MSYKSYWSYLAALVPCTGINCTLCDLFTLTQNIFNFVAIQLVPIVAILLIFWGGYTFLISSGSPAGITKGKSILKNTVIGLVIVYSAYLAASYIVSFFAGAGSVASSSFTSRGFVVQCERVELENKTGIEIGNLTEELLIAPEPPVVFADGDLSVSTDIANVKINDGVDVNGLQDNVKSSLRAAAAAASEPGIGITLVVTSGFRHVDRQIELVNQNCVNPDADRCEVKKGGVETCIPKDDGFNCRHTTGKAVDVWCQQSEGGAKCYQATLFNQVMKPNGWCVLKRENWHFELKTDLDQDPDRRSAFNC
ncbi:MAG: hypothetical protein WAP55_00255 [Minisyncoccia bacterium]